MKVAGIAVICLFLGACAEQEAIHWVRADGQTVSEAPTLAKQFQMDEAYCQGEMAKADSAAGPSSRRFTTDPIVYRGCMAGRGYIEQK